MLENPCWKSIEENDAIFLSFLFSYKKRVLFICSSLSTSFSCMGCGSQNFFFLSWGAWKLKISPTKKIARNDLIE